jgi:hypothetical protein
MPALKKWTTSIALTALGWASACGNDDAQDPMTGGGASVTPAAGGIMSNGGGGQPANGGAHQSMSGSKASGNAGNELTGGDASSGGSGGSSSGGAVHAGTGGEPNGDAGAAGSDLECPAQPATVQLPCPDFSLLWSPSYVLESNQWLFDASTLEFPLQSGSLTFFNTYSSSDFPLCGVVSLEASGDQLVATLTADTHYLVASHIARFEVTDLCGNRYEYAPMGLACGAIEASEASAWLGSCVKACPGACDRAR